MKFKNSEEFDNSENSGQDCQSLEVPTGNTQYNTFSSNLSLNMASLEDDLSEWIEEACQEPVSSPERVGKLNAMFRRIYSDRRFWMYYKSFKDFYPEGLSQMWQYLLDNLCEATEGRKNPSFELTRQFAVGRLLLALKGRLLNLAKKNTEESQRFRDCYDADGNYMNPGEYLPAPNSITPEACDRYLELLQQDPTGELRKVYVRGKQDVTMQKYLLLEYEGTKPQAIAETLQVSFNTLYRNENWKGKVQYWKRELARRALDAVSDRHE